MSQNCNSSNSVDFDVQEKAQIQALLTAKLGPEWISFRQAGGGQKVAYVEGWKVLHLANSTFGFDGWSSCVKSLTTDFCIQTQKGSFNVGVTAIIRVELKDGTYREDIGYGVCEGQKSMALSLEKVGLLS